MALFARNSGHKRRQPSTDIDRICSLPSSVLSHIISLLPTKNAVATSLVSRGWKFLWTNIHNLSFIGPYGSFYENEDQHIKFACSVNKVLLFLNQQTIEKFHLEIGENCKVYDVTTWIAIAVARNLKMLMFSICFCPSDQHIQLPHSLFTCMTLQVLVLSNSVSLNVPSSVSLPNLKDLHLEFLRYQSDESVRNLLSGCSSLETLFIQRDQNDNVITFTISSPTLINLTFKFCDWYYRSEFDYELEINAPALRYLTLLDYTTKDFSVKNLCSLDRANIETGLCLDDYEIIDYNHYAKSVAELLHGVNKVKHLSLKGETLKVLSHAGACLNFLRLTHLTVDSALYGWNSLISLIEGSNKLQYLTLQCYEADEEAHVTRWSKPRKVPKCMLSCLKTVSMDGFDGEEDDIEMIAYILKNAKVLSTLTIRTSWYLNSDTKLQLLQKISMFPRESRKCQVSFS